MLGLPTSHKCGFTLVECLVYIAIWSSVAITTMWALHEAELTRTQARQAAELALIAHSQLEHARAIPSADLHVGSADTTSDDWPAGTSCTVTLAQRSASAWLINVEVSRTMARPIKPVRLATYRRALP